MMENYIKILSIEAQTMLMMVKRDVLPASVTYLNELAACVVNKNAVDTDISSGYEKTLIRKISMLCEYLYNNLLELETALINSKDIEDVSRAGRLFQRKRYLRKCSWYGKHRMSLRPWFPQNIGRIPYTAIFFSAYNLLEYRLSDKRGAVSMCFNYRFHREGYSLFGF
jgi:hypothetical protein